MNKMNQLAGRAGETGSLQRCLASCRKAVEQVKRIRETIFNETREILWAQERVIRLALNEAEALAWQTAYPHLVFPTLAAEKVQAVVDWDARQKSVRRPAEV